MDISTEEVSEAKITFSHMFDLIERQRELNEEIDRLFENDPCWSALSRMLDENEAEVFSSIIYNYRYRIYSGVHND